jgi:2-keto-3-deoxy-L-rhamnonate aldolase RhmA
LCRTARLLDLPLIVRPESSVFHLIRKYVDMGAAGLMIPWTERQDQIDTLREAMFVPPRGKRGPGGPAIFANRTLDRAGWDEIEASLFTMIQIESPAGLKNLTRLANQPWIDAVMVGPYDLSLSIDRCGRMDDPDLIDTIGRIRTEAASIGKPAGMVVGSAGQAKRWIDCGIRLLIVSEPAVMVRQHVRGLVESIRDLCPPE